MYYITSLAKFGNWYSMTLAVGKANERAGTMVFPFQRRWQKRYTLFYNVFSDMILYISAYYKSFSYQKLSQRQYVLLLWWSGTVATVLRSLKSVVRKYVSPRIIFCLYHPDLSSLDQYTFIILNVLSVQPGCCQKMIHGFPDKYWTVVSDLAPSSWRTPIWVSRSELQRSQGTRLDSLQRGKLLDSATS